MKAIRISAYGGADVLTYEDVADPVAAPDQALVQVEAAGVNFIDIYQRTGAYPLPLPVILGQEGAGTVVAVGNDVTSVKAGDRVGWIGSIGSYAERVALPAHRLVPLPQQVTARQGAAALFQGATAHYLATSTYALGPGKTCLVHAGAGGVGLLLTQIAKLKGARVITTVSTPDKARLSEAAGADAAVVYTSEDFEAAVRRLTDGKGVDVVYDSVGQTTFAGSLRSLALRGTLVLFGQSSGPAPPIDPQSLSKYGSLFLTRPTLFHHIADDEELRWRASDVLGWVAAGQLRLQIEHEFPLQEAADAHRALEGRRTTGKVLLHP